MTQAQDDFRNNEGEDSRNFKVWYGNLATQRIVRTLYQKALQKERPQNKPVAGEKKELLEPYVFFDGMDMISFNDLMTLSKDWFLQSDKNYFPFVFKPELGGAHYMAGILRKEKNGEVTFFLFNPVGYPDDEAKKRAQRRLLLPSINHVGGMRLIMSPHQIQSSEKDGGVLVSCGPLCIEFIDYALNNPDWIEQLDENFILPEHLMQYSKDTQPEYQRRIEVVRLAHDELLGEIGDELLDEIDDYYVPANKYFIDGVGALVGADDQPYENYDDNLDDLSVDDNLDDLSVHDELDDVNSTKEAEEEPKVVSSPIQEKEKRSRQNVIAALNRELKSYQEERELRFLLKDKLMSQDQSRRNEFIKSINNELNVFVKSGDSSHLINLIIKEMNNYPGVYLKTTLHRIVLALVEPTPATDFSETAKSICKNQAKEHKGYIQKVNELYKKIDSMKHFAQKLSDSEEKRVVNELAEQLKKDVDYFVSQHPKAVPAPQSFNQFKIKFSARLHSQDVLMRNHENWDSFVINLLLALISVGIALGVKAIHSKLTTGEVRFFASESKKEKAVSDIQQTLEDIKPSEDGVSFSL